MWMKLFSYNRQDDLLWIISTQKNAGKFPKITTFLKTEDQTKKNIHQIKYCDLTISHLKYDDGGFLSVLSYYSLSEFEYPMVWT